MLNHVKDVLLCLSELQILTFIVAALIFYFLAKRDSRQDKFLRGVPGPPTLPFLGNVVSYLIKAPHEYLEIFHSWYKTYGSLFVVWIGNKPIVVCCEAKEVEAILSSTTHIVKSQDYELLHKWLGLGLLTAKPQRWHTMRKLLTPSFHFKILEEFLPIFNEQADVLVGILKKQRGDGQPFNMFPYITKCTLDIICETAMGVKLNSQSKVKGEEGEYVSAVDRYGALLLYRFIRPWLQINAIWKICGYAAKEERYVNTLHSFTSKVIADKQRERLCRTESEVIVDDLENPYIKKRKAFLDLLLDMAEEHNLTDTIIREETDTFMFEGHDTTAANLIWTIMNLSQFPEHQKLVQDELDEIFEGEKNVDITAAHISRMKYLECCVKETLRLYPSVPFYFRQLTEDFRIGNHLIPKGISVGIPDYILHRDPEVFPNPEAFKPERFLVSEGSAGRNPYAFVPFSAGPRNCIGQKFALLEEKIVLAKLFSNFTFTAAEKLEDIKMVPDIILRPLNGVKVSITPRY